MDTYRTPESRVTDATSYDDLLDAIEALIVIATAEDILESEEP